MLRSGESLRAGHPKCARIHLLISATSEIYERLDYSVQDVEDAVGAPITISNDKATVIMGRMRMPSLSLHGIEGAFYGPGAKTVIPASVAGKFSIRFVLFPTAVA